MIRWIASYPKSGNTYARLLLLAYDDPDNFDFNFRPRHFRQDNDTEVFKRLVPVPFDQLTRDEIYLIRGNALVWLNRMAAPKPAYLKTHSANISMDWRPLIPVGLTESSLALIRDPRDVAVSFADHMGWDVDRTIAYMADEQAVINREGTLRQPITTWSLHVRSWMRDVPWPQMAVRYEDLVAEPERCLRDMIRHFGLAYCPARLRDAVALTRFDALKAEEDKRGYDMKSKKQKRFFRCGVAGGWRDVLSEAHASRIVSDHGEAMQLCGYV